MSKAKRLKKVASKQAQEPKMSTVMEGQGDTSPYVPDQRNKIDWDLHIRERKDLTIKQKALIDLILHRDTNVVFITGPAGTSKTWLAVYCGLLLMRQRRVSHLTFVRTVIESASKSLGALPGEADQKMAPYLMPLMDKLEEMLPSAEVKRLINEERAEGRPINYLRGASLNAQFIIADEAQNFTVKELTTLLTRIGKYSKMVIVGDPEQSDVNGASGLHPLAEWFNQPSHQEHGIHCVTLTSEDIVRSGIVRHIVEELSRYRTAHPTKH